MAVAVAQARSGGLDDFYAGMAVFDGFGSVMDPAVYHPLPGDWFLGITDVVRSTQAIAAGRFKTVNTAGAAAIAAISNALDRRDFPYVFGGDGCSFAVSGADAPRAREAAAATATWVSEDLALELRVAMVPVTAVRTAGFDVRVARFAPSPNVAYAMFAGGGLAWAEREMKLGRFAVPPAPAGTRPDLTGLSCRWSEIAAEHGLILSLLVAPKEPAQAAAFGSLVQEILAMVSGAEAGRPMPARHSAGRRRGWTSRHGPRAIPAAPCGFASSISIGLPSWAISCSVEIPVGQFNPARYKRELVENADFRKYDDGLRMTLDCSPALADRLEARLREAEAQVCPLRPASAGLGRNDLRGTLDHGEQPRPLRRRCRRRLRRGCAHAQGRPDLAPGKLSWWPRPGRLAPPGR